MTGGARFCRRGITVHPFHSLDAVRRRARADSSRNPFDRSLPRIVTGPPTPTLIRSRSLLPLVRRRRPVHISDRRRRYRVAMVSWSEDDDSSEGEHGRYYQYATSGSDDGIVKIPATTDDSEFEGNDYVLCHEHRKRAERLVAFEGIHTGRRFLACAVKDGKNCGLVE
ncbi:uncharacterized protein [Aegilops tauschii subsp. strangulata]|uniref:uncharacterized protein n=1 Tax=Aegilops tauschii subsp. strangulata TaxID=200361 RepID=UPI003CC8CDC1